MCVWVKGKEGAQEGWDMGSWPKDKRAIKCTITMKKKSFSFQLYGCECARECVRVCARVCRRSQFQQCVSLVETQSRGTNDLRAGD